MADIKVTDGGKEKSNKPHRKVLRVDFTPMVDMNMLLITFFMFCTTLAIPQVLDIAMPAPSDNPAQSTQERASRAVTIILDKDNKVYYYSGIPNYEDYTSLKETDYNGLREMLLERNATNVGKIIDIKKQRYNKEISEEVYKAQLKEIKNDKDGITIVIKPTSNSCFKNLVDALDEMQICSIGKYAVVDMTDGDNYLLESYLSKGQLITQNK